MGFLDKTAPAIRRETKYIMIAEIIGVAAMLIVFGIGHLIIPDKIPFGITVILGGLVGGFVAVLNFFLMGITVQKVSSAENEELGRRLMKASYSRRMLMQMAWVVIAIVAPCFQFAAGIIPLLFPSAAAKLRSVIKF